MKKTWNKSGEGELPKEHWLHKAMAKEKARHAKKSAVAAKKPVTDREVAKDDEMGQMMGGV